MFTYKNAARLLGIAAALLVPVIVVAAVNAYSFVDSTRGDIVYNDLPQRLALVSARSDLGVPMTAAAGTPSGTMGIDRTAGSVMVLAGEQTSSNAKTDKAMWEFNLGPMYRAGNSFTVTVNAQYLTGGTVTGASTTLTLAAYSEVNGVETALTVTPSTQTLPSAATDLAYVVTGTGLTARARVVVEATVLVTSASGGNEGIINKVDVSY